MSNARRGSFGEAVSTAELKRKRRLLRQVPVLVHVVKQQLCSETELLNALVTASFGDGDYIYCQGQAERDLFFIEEGRVLITQRRRCRAMSTVRLTAADPPTPNSEAPASTLAPATEAEAEAAASGWRRTRRRSQLEAELEIQLHTYEELEHFGEETLLQSTRARLLNAVASGAVSCLVLPEPAFATLLAPVHELLLHRHLLRAHNVLAKDRLFQHLSARQQRHILDHCTLERFVDGQCIVRQGDKNDRRYFILVDGEADVVLDEPTRPSASRDVQQDAETLHEKEEKEDVELEMTVVSRKTLYQSFGEMGLLERPRTANVVAVGAVLCAVVTRKDYIAACQLLAASAHVDTDAEALLATSLMEEWALAVNTRRLELANPLVARHLVTFVKKFKAAYSQKFEGKTLYLELLRRLYADPALGDEFPFVAARVSWDAPTSSLGILRAEMRRVLSRPAAERSAFECSFVGRLLETTNFLDKFDRPTHVDKLRLARGLAREAAFVTIPKDQHLFRQGRIESRAFLILRGSINIVNEDVSALQPGNTAVKHHEVLATLSAGDSFGELSLVTRLQRSATAIAACEADLLVLERAHLLALSAALPGVSVQHAMVERAEFLATLSFFRGSDFAQCIRVAHDLQDQTYEPRHLFLQEPNHLRSLYIVKSGEVAVFLRRNVPVTNADDGATSSTSTSTVRSVLVRVATIGPHEFFGVAIANASTLAPVAASSPASGSSSGPTTGVGSPVSANTAGMAPPQPTTSSASGSPLPSSTQAANAQHYVAATLAAATSGTGGAPHPDGSGELSATVFMCSTRVQMLELSERGWRRLTLRSLHSIRSSLLERHRWNLETVERQHAQGSLAYYHVDKPWQLVARGPTPNAIQDGCSEVGTCPRGLELSSTTQLARQLKEKKRQQQQQGRTTVYSRLFAPTTQSPRQPQVADRQGALPPLIVAGLESPRVFLPVSRLPSNRVEIPSEVFGGSSSSPCQSTVLSGSFELKAQPTASSTTPRLSIVSRPVASSVTGTPRSLVSDYMKLSNPVGARPYPMVAVASPPPSRSTTTANDISPRHSMQLKLCGGTRPAATTTPRILQDNANADPYSAMWKLQRRPSSSMQ